MVPLALMVDLDGHGVRMPHDRPYDNCQMTFVR